MNPQDLWKNRCPANGVSIAIYVYFCYPFYGYNAGRKCNVITQAEEIFSLSEAAGRLPRINGRRPHVSTLWRWCRKGLKGVRLEYVRVGSKIAVSRQGLDRFFVELAAADAAAESTPPPTQQPAAQKPRSEKARARAIEAARRKLKAAGV